MRAKVERNIRNWRKIPALLTDSELCQRRAALPDESLGGVSKNPCAGILEAARGERDRRRGEAARRITTSEDGSAFGMPVPFGETPRVREFSARVAARNVSAAGRRHALIRPFVNKKRRARARAAVIWSRRYTTRTRHFD